MLDLNNEQMKRFEAKFTKKGTNQCWLWSAATVQNGYGQVRFKNKAYLAHRASYLLYTGNIPSGMKVCHSCDNRLCVNPNHLWLGTQKDNLHDMWSKKRGRGNNKVLTKCKKGHEFTEENTSTVTKKVKTVFGGYIKRTYKRCKECHKIRNKKHWQNRKDLNAAHVKIRQIEKAQWGS